jgi:hypothetical protein
MDLYAFLWKKNKQTNKLRGPQSTSELYRLSDRLFCEMCFIYFLMCSN